MSLKSRAGIIAGFGSCVFIASICASSWKNSPSIDEMGHIAAGLSHWQLGKFDLYAVNPPLARSIAAIPAMLDEPAVTWDGYSHSVSHRSEFALGRHLVRDFGMRTIDYVRIGRLMLLPFLLMGLFAVARWAERLVLRTGNVAILLAAVSPAMLSNGSMITPDALAATMGLIFVYSTFEWSKTSTHRWSTTVRTGIFLGLALLCKFTLLLLLALPAWLFVSPPSSGRNASRLNSRVQLFCIGLLALYVFNVGYGFEGTGTSLSDFEFVSPCWDKVGSGKKNCFDGTLLGSVPVPLPQNCIAGIDTQKRDFEVGFRSYLMGEWKHGGWWYYYLIGFLVKEPIGFQLMLYVSILHGLYHWKKWNKHSIREWSFVVLPPLLVFGLVSSQTGFNHHMRYVLPAYPFLFIIAARTITLGRFWKWFSYACLTWQVVSVLWFAPHWMSYFNEFAGGPKNGHDWLVDSNIDWGQDILRLKWWQDEHPDVDLQAALFTGFDPKDIGLKFQLPAPYIKGEPNVVNDAGLRGPQPGWYAVSVCQLKGHYFNVPKGDGEWAWSAGHFTYFLDHFQPVDMIGYSIYIYHITPDQAATVQAKLAEEEEKFLKTNPNGDAQACSGRPLSMNAPHQPRSRYSQCIDERTLRGLLS